MATPVLQLIKDVLLARLKNITRANGYAFNVGEVKYISRNKDEYSPEPRDILIEQVGQEEVEEHFRPGNPPAVAYDISFVIHGFALQLDEHISEPGITDNSVTEPEMIAAVRKAVTNNSATDWFQFGGNSIDARFNDVAPFDGPGQDGVTNTLTILYRTSELDATVVRS